MKKFKYAYQVGGYGEMSVPEFPESLSLAMMR